ncbi:chromate transporter [Alteribacter lacisalsi]|uniref:Chromate transporter n=1 Tax=Alteribacter lacisalsi TaxID=2045244 RepID=A0A2W0HIW1_9BACI|nr:chromate transporter [Alteribacter lacisalsi]PYZ96922.1 chromate transporter [Alteribacter lacisalsi]
MTQRQIFMAFFRIGMLGYGGGPASIPLIHKEAVDKYKWMKDEEFSDILAMGNTLPGPIATKMAGYIGYRVAGITGMLNAIAASVVPTVVLMIVLLVSLASFREYAWVQGMTNGVLPVVGVMLAVLTWQFFTKSKEGLGFGWSIMLVIVSALLITAIGLHPAFVIAGLLVFVFLKRTKGGGD